MRIFLWVPLWLGAALSSAFHTTHRANCQRQRVCNGNLMCAEICQRGSVAVDSWAVNALKYQRQLQRQDKLVYYELPSTHNSAITEADGYGIEKYFISALMNGKDYDQGDDLGEGVCQYLSLTDQLRMGVRHLEIDLWWLNKKVLVCHSPVPLYPVGNISRAAEDAHLDLQWEPNKLSCVGTNRAFKEVLQEVYDWMMQPENLQEIVVLYFDTKDPLPADGVTLANNDILAVFGEMLWKPSDGNPLEATVDSMLTFNKRVLIENQKECWTKPSEGEPLVFYPALWTHQFSASGLQEFPDCSVEGDKDWYGKQWVRALDGSFIEAATRCGVQIASGDYLNPDEMKLYVWSWEQEQPSTAAGCVAMQPSGRWATVDCDRALPYACAIESSAGAASANWLVDLGAVGPWSKATCLNGTTFAAPHDGYSNNQLLLAAYGQTVWLNAPNPLR